MLSVLMGMAVSNDVVFLSHQLQFALLLTVLACYITHELHRGHGRWAAWLLAAACFLLIDPLRHVVYDAQFNPAACGPPGSLMSRDDFFALAFISRAGQVLGNLMIFASMFRSSLASLAEATLATLGEEDSKHT
ncbi:unnamed protein product [Symbiodinium natans]|uniref:Uncharacterized protein n=1 Tax=Symbiodinium natans TaxID=878477 RepID=A0A812S400_9DINO|nr:unnamed protein product [Symbiodinium natans]